MNKTKYKVMSVIVSFMLMLGSVNSANASSAVSAQNPQSQVAALTAFPGAEGFGANTIGGRGGKIFEVSNLNDAGVGSLRTCVDASGARTCIFRVGGLISLNSPLTIKNPYITIAGQTAPGGGITIKLGTATEVFLTQTHDVIIRYITVRSGPGGENHDNQIGNDSAAIYNIMIDHNSLSWGVDSNIETWYRVYNTSIQWSIISEGLSNSTHSKGEHSKGLMIGGYAGSDSHNSIGSENISVLNNLMAHNLDRNPLMQLCGIAQVINNVSYNAGTTFSHQQLNCLFGTSYVNWINNYHKKGLEGPQTDLKIIPSDGGVCSSGKTYMSGNVGNNGAWTYSFSGSCDASKANILTTTPAPGPYVTSTNASSAYNSVLADAGNSAGISCDGSWYSRRDAIDTRIINDVKNGTGNIIDNPSQVGGWITPATGVPCADSDHDGMPDTWEQLHGFNPTISDGSGDKDGDGYTNVEEYFNGTNPLDSISQTTTFADVPSTYWAYAWIDLVFQNGLTGGCGSAPLIYCPENSVTRAEMAVFLERGMKGSGYTPPNVTTQFGDTANHSAQDWIDALASDGITAGCGGGNYCPNNPVTRAQMAVFLLRAKYGRTYSPPPATGAAFSDIPFGSFADAWIERLVAEGVTAGCGGGNYCPNSPVTRAQMAVFLARTFNLK